jgi:hypothetical protein
MLILALPATLIVTCTLVQQVPGLPNAPQEGVPVLSLVSLPRRALPEESAHLEATPDVPRPAGAAIQARHQLHGSVPDETQVWLRYGEGHAFGWSCGFSIGAEALQC